VTLIATSSTLLLINVAIFLLFPTKLEDARINTHVAPFNLESMMSNIGALFVCGVGVKRESDEAKAGKLAEAAKKKNGWLSCVVCGEQRCFVGVST
jgi:hypothetical protein